MARELPKHAGSVVGLRYGSATSRTARRGLLTLFPWQLLYQQNNDPAAIFASTCLHRKMEAIKLDPDPRLFAKKALKSQ